MRRVAGIKAWVEEYDAVVKEVEDLRLMPEFVKEGVVTEQELDEQYARAMHRIEELELRNMLRRDEDRMGAIMDINSGAGGTEALDWAGMLLRMYTRWGEAHGYKVKVLDYQAGDEVGVKSCTCSRWKSRRLVITASSAMSSSLHPGCEEIKYGISC